MKFILSRKGFDSGYGGYPSPILEDGFLMSLPIPSTNDMKYSNLKYGNNSYFDLMNKLFQKIRVNNARIDLTSDTTCHLDPDIYKGVKERKLGWRGAFGQIGAAERHLENQNIGVGDIFLFFGWYKKITSSGYGNFIYDPSDHHGKHILYGYLEVDKIIKPQQGDDIPDWLKGHPHLAYSDKSNAIYIAKEKLSLNPSYPGYGTFKFGSKVVLTKDGHARSHWELPEFFKKVIISYHENQGKYGWKEDYFQSAHKGQEFVFESTMDIQKWLLEMVKSNLYK